MNIATSERSRMNKPVQLDLSVENALGRVNKALSKGSNFYEAVIKGMDAVSNKGMVLENLRSFLIHVQNRFSKTFVADYSYDLGTIKLDGNSSIKDILNFLFYVNTKTRLEVEGRGFAVNEVLRFLNEKDQLDLIKSLFGDINSYFSQETQLLSTEERNIIIDFTFKLIIRKILEGQKSQELLDYIITNLDNQLEISSDKDKQKIFTSLFILSYLSGNTRGLNTAKRLLFAGNLPAKPQLKEMFKYWSKFESLKDIQPESEESELHKVYKTVVESREIQIRERGSEGKSTFVLEQELKTIHDAYRTGLIEASKLNLSALISDWDKMIAKETSIISSMEKILTTSGPVNFQAAMGIVYK